MKAQKAVDDIYTNLKEIPTTSSMQQLQSSMVLIDNETGDIVAIAGGVGQKSVYFAYNRATVRLQPGSSLKPLTVYAPAFELGMITPATIINDMPLFYTGSEEHQYPFPRNDTKQYGYSYNIFRGITYSVNAIAVNTLDAMGLQTSFYFARDKFRLSGLLESYVNSYGSHFTDIAYAPLGMGAPTFGVTVRDMSAAYATFANHGVWREPRTYTHVYTNDGELLYHNEQDSEKILSEKTCQYISYCLTNAVNYGTGTAAYINGQGIAGKTGTTGNSKDRWFCGDSS
jgi:penicillin-binding protein 1A